MEIHKANIKFKSKPTKRSKTHYIILHCSATPEGRDYTPEQVHQWHLQRGWIGCGYNFIISRDGTIWECRPMDTTGAHCTGYNSKSVGICYIGGMDADNKHPKDTRTVEQKKSLLELVQYLMDKYNITLDKVHCHNEFANKACPSFKIYDFRNEYMKWITSKD